MESAEIRPTLEGEGRSRGRGRGRKRTRNDTQNNGLVDRRGWKKAAAVETRSKAFVGRYVKKEFEGSGSFLGKIVYYDRGLYRVNYEDGDCEDLESGEVKEFLIEDEDFDDDDGELIVRKTKLDELVLLPKKDVKTMAMEVTDVNVMMDSVVNAAMERRVEAKEELIDDVKVMDSAANALERRVEAKEMTAVIGMDSVNAMEERVVVVASSLSELSNSGANEVDDGVQVDSDADSSTDSCEYGRDNSDPSMEVEPAALLPPPPQLPPSSGNIGVPDEYISHLFSVYSFLRSFSIQLFLSPFAIDDFVGSLNSPVPNTLLDSIHVALMRALRRHLETLSSDSSELASKCMRCIDWSLLDSLTWPVYLVQYLMVMGYTKGTEWKGFYLNVVERDYHSLSAGRKLLILQILCDDILDSAELRAEIDMREEAEGGIDADAVTAIAPENGPRRVHPRYSKTSACKDQEAMEIISESHEIKSSCKSSSLGLTGTEPGAVDDADQDGNGDECRLCGMDGTLLCCDGCPSAYHSRCIGVSKALIPDGVWYCPECAINKIGPRITWGTSLRGGEVFGIDTYEQVFIGTCNHLLVLKISINSEPCLRYYNQNDILDVLRALLSSVEHIASYSVICRGILHYWEVPEDVLSLPDIAQMDTTLVQKKENGEYFEGVNSASCVTESSAENIAISCLDNGCKQAGFTNTHLDTLTRIDHPGQQRNSDSTRKQVCTLNDTKFSEQMEYTICAGSVSKQAGPSDLTHQSLADKSSAIGFAPCTSGNSSGCYRGNANGMRVTPNISLQNKEGNYRIVGSLFKPQSYINHYVHGDFAASAAANLAIISSEENRVSGFHALNNPKKVVSASVLLQVKAFSSAAIRFFWPNVEKKLAEVPRERCGWCLSCKAPASSKKACLLNAAASNAIKGAMKILASLRPVRNRDGSLHGIATYVIFIEESLCGLTVGPFLNATYRRQWRKLVEQATTCSALKTLLLELEENIRNIALSGDWFKVMDCWATESSVTQNGTPGIGSVQKRGPSGRRGRKQSVIDTTDDSFDNSSDFVWWRGGTLSKLIFQKGILPHSLVTKAARQGGSRKIPGTHYVENSDVPKRSRQFVWRAAVEMSRTASQLALQVRYLDLHVRWSDLVRPEQNLLEGKGSETEASIFRNAFICDKKIIDNNIRYGVVFRSQKHLPSRVMKSIIEEEQSQDGKEKCWFSETRIPLYLIKEYEEKLEKMFLPSAEKPTNALSKLQKRQLKASRKDIFSFLSRKRENLDMCGCASCQLDVFLRNAVKCSACQGFCHQQCTISSTVHMNEEVEFLITCKQCCRSKGVTQNENNNETPKINERGQEFPKIKERGQEFQSAKTATRVARQKPSTPVAILETSSEMKIASHGSRLTSSRRKLCSWGLIWKKKGAEDTGTNFRIQNILLKGNADMVWPELVCHLCRNPYNPELMYIRCETCNNWYHAEALELEESKIFDLVGFKCCRCRRIRSPVCPFLDPDSKKRLEDKMPRTRTSKQGNSGMDLEFGMTSEQPKEVGPTAPLLPMKDEVLYVPEDDPLLFSLSTVEQFTEPNSEVECEWNIATASVPGPQKLPVRRQMKQENEVNGFPEFSTTLEANDTSNPKEELLSPQVEWDVSTNGFEDNLMFDYDSLYNEGMEFEPQTYFSFTELLDGDDASRDTLENLSVISGDGNTEQYGAGISGVKLEPTVSIDTDGDIVPCWECSQTEPCPDLSCQICGLRVHSQCSMWVEQSSSLEGGWRCGNCREWR